MFARLRFERVDLPEVVVQLGIQAAAVAMVTVYVVVMTLVLVVLVDKTLGFRVDEATEMSGLDYNLHGEQGYGLLHPS